MTSKLKKYNSSGLENIITTTNLDHEENNSFDANYLLQYQTRLNSGTNNLLDQQQWKEIGYVPYYSTRDSSETPSKIKIRTQQSNSDTEDVSNTSSKGKHQPVSLVSTSKLIDAIKITPSTIEFTVNGSTIYNELNPNHTIKYIVGGSLYSKVMLDEKTQVDLSSNLTTIKYIYIKDTKSSEPNQTYRTISSQTGSHVQVVDALDSENQPLASSRSTLKIMGGNKNTYQLITSEYQLRIFADKNSRGYELGAHNFQEPKKLTLYEGAKLIFEINFEK